MTDKTISIKVALSASPGFEHHWTSPALALPRARVTTVEDEYGLEVRELAVDHNGISVAEVRGAPKWALIEIPADLQLPSDIERDKLALEREKVALDDANRRKTLTWSVGSAVLTAAVTIFVAWIGKFGGGNTEVKLPARESIQVCRDSLKRLPVLAAIQDQSVATLGEAIRRHDANCDELLIGLLPAGR